MKAPMGDPRSTILVADPQLSAREKAAGVLREAGYRVEVTVDGQEALERYRTAAPDLLVLDIMMPRMSGLDLVRVLRANPRDPFVPIILVSQRSDIESRVGGLRAGADDFLPKPYDGAELVARVESMLRIKRRHEELSRSVRELEKGAIIDPATGVYNERFFQRRLPEEFARAQRYDDTLALLRLEGTSLAASGERSGLAGLAGFAGTAGPAGTDRSRRSIAEALGRVVRTVDLVARLGGDEFVLLLPSTHFAGVLPVAQRLQATLRPLALTASIGASFFPSKQISKAEDLVEQAGLALARARAEGPGWVCLHQHQSYLYRPGEP
jgi:PleD family two-component response regulator